MTATKVLTRKQAAFLANAFMDFCQSTGRNSDFRMACRIAARLNEPQVKDWLDERRAFFAKIKLTDFRTLLPRQEESR